MQLYSMIRCAVLLPALACLAQAQDSLVWISSSDGMLTRSGGNGLRAVGTVNNDGMMFVTPIPGIDYTADPYFPGALHYVWYGDADNDGDFVKSTSTGPWGLLDAVFVKRYLPGAGLPPLPTARTLYHSFAAPSYTNTSGTVTDGDVLRFSSNYDVEKFATEAQFATAVGGGDIGINAICQDIAGNLYFSMEDTETVTIGSSSDGDLWYIPVASIVYDALGNVSSFAADSAIRIATEADIDVLVANAGVLDADGDPFTAITDLGALEIDPNGGTFIAPQNSALALPNLIFGSDHVNSDFAIFSTKNGGSIATINTVPMGSKVATTGHHMGITPDTGGGDALEGLGVIPLQPKPFVLKPTTNEVGSSTAGWVRAEVAGATPNGSVYWFLGFADLVDRFSILTVPGFSGEVYGAGLLLGLGPTTADADGYAGYPFLIPDVAYGVGAAAFQALDISAKAFSTPGAFEF